MLRLFKQHKVRKIEELNGQWNFSVDNQPVIQMPVPGCWEQNPQYQSYRGQATYTKKILVEENNSTLRLEFKGVSHTADVYFDNQKIAHHYNAYTPFSAVISNVDSGEHEIKVLVDNSFNENSALHVPNDYYTYGGITRGVSVAQISALFIERIQFTPKKDVNSWNADIELVIKNTSTESKHIKVKVKLAGKEIWLEKIISPESTEKLSQVEIFSNVTEWQPDQPALYFLEAILFTDDIEVDDLIERVGFREVEIIGNKLFVNNTEIFLKGFNRHEDYNHFGCAIPFQAMVHDMDIMQDLGANSVRTCHYPNDELFLDLCDERGILVWEENHARGFDLAAMENPNFDQQCSDCNQEMVESHYNHPSIIIWGILNECASETEIGRKKYQAQYEQIRQLDKSRPLTSATCRHFTDICLDLPDIVSFNMYTGWYQDMSVTERHESEMKWINEAGGQGKPIIVSEFGAGAIYGYRDRARQKWSEERQLDIIESNMEVYMNDPRLMGVYIWQFADCRVCEEDNWFATRPRTHNNKGILDEYRRPKMAYDVVKKYFESN